MCNNSLIVLFSLFLSEEKWVKRERKKSSHALWLVIRGDGTQIPMDTTRLSILHAASSKKWTADEIVMPIIASISVTRQLWSERKVFFPSQVSLSSLLAKRRWMSDTNDGTIEWICEQVIRSQQSHHDRKQSEKQVKHAQLANRFSQQYDKSVARHIRSARIGKSLFSSAS